MTSFDKNIIKNMNKKVQLWLSFFIVLALIGCGQKTETIVINGFTMGTTYSIKIINFDKLDIDTDLVKSKIDSSLIEVNQQMSTYIEDSEISIFNTRQDLEWQEISNDFYDVIHKSIEISKLTDGAFDITVGPLMDLWGFGNSNQDDWQPPTNSEVEYILKYIRFDNINISENRIRKFNPRTVIDLNAIAKGYGVDVVFELLQDCGFENILVEIGGEIRCGGLNQDSEYWRVGIDKPIFDILPGQDLQELIEMDDNALATSGDYRNYFIYDEKIYSHTIDPRNGYPIEDGIASASVTAPTCMLADVLATSLMVLGKNGLELVEELEDVEALIINRIGEEEFISVKSSGWGAD